MVRSPFSSLKVLIVDQDSFAANLMNQVLLSFELGGIHAERRLSSAIEAIKETKVDLVLCDWLIDEDYPLALIDFIRKDPDCPNHKIPIIMCTGFTEISRVIQARDSGVNEIIAKPIAPHNVLKKLQAVVSSGRQFVASDAYVGPDRRRRAIDHGGPERRGKYGLKQEQIDTVMNEQEK